MSGERRDVVRGYLLEVLTTLRHEFASRLKAQRQQFPNQQLPCETCAFRAGTDSWKGMDQTVTNLIAAMATRQIFYCHEGIGRTVDGEYAPPMKTTVTGRVEVDLEQMHPCAAWLVLQSTPPFRISSVVPKQMRDICIEIANSRGVAS